MDVPLVPATAANLTDAIARGWIQAVELEPGRISYRVERDLTIRGNARATRGALLTFAGAEFIFEAGPVYLDVRYE